MIRLFVNVDHVATLRQARKTVEPDPLHAAHLAEQAGAHGITIHLREDRRHIQDSDVYRIQQGIRTPLNLEMAAVEEMVRIAETVLPYQVSLVPEKRQEVTTEGGLDVVAKKAYLTETRLRLAALHIRFSLFVDPDPKQMDAARDIGADSIEINTGQYTEAPDAAGVERELQKIQTAARHAHSLGLRVFAGHGLNNENVVAIAAIPEVEELNIGHNLVARSVYCGMEQAVRDMIARIQKGEALRTVSA